ncbi:MAG TPA: NAD(P)H-dependent oxidoreductase subunit E [Rectinemataceae bacterium]|nr:NAD(P)H-dependent oxidoreductase subunit E [Rectinemataceae bacterium]
MERRDTLLASLHAEQAASGHSWLSPEALAALRRRFGLTKATLRGVASYYSMLSLRPRGRHLLRLCVSPVCRMIGSLDLLSLIESELGLKTGETDAEGEFTLETAHCLGRCAGAPAMMVDDRVYAGLDIDKVRTILRELREGGTSFSPDAASYAAHIGPGPSPRGAPPEAAHGAGQGAVPDSSVPRVSLAYGFLRNPEDIDEYCGEGGYEAFKLALARDPLELIDEFERARVRGRGGAGFSAAVKERSTAAVECDESCERYVVCNADEGEPGTFKDRILMEREPHLLLEGMLIAGWAVGARRGYIYVRGEYGLAIERLEAALRSARDAGLLGTPLPGSAFVFDIELRRGAGSYLCGEELTLLESLEGKRGYPRIKPPFPAESGLWGRPTLVNNVETLVQLPWVVREGADAYLRLGTASSPGTKIFCVSGDVARPGYGEWEFGIPLGRLIEAAGGCIDLETGGSAPPLAVLLGGAAGTFVPGEALDLPMDYDALRTAGATLGSGAVIVIGRGRSLAGVISAIMDFFEHESCGKCVPCRVGTAALAEQARELVALCESRAGRERGRVTDMLAAMVRDAQLMAKTSLCPLGQSPVLPLQSAQRSLGDLL